MNPAALGIAITALVLAMPSSVEAQTTDRVFRLAVLSPVFPREQHLMLRLMLKELSDRGIQEGRNLLVEHRSAAGRLERLGDLAAELVATKPDVIFAEAPPSVRAVMKATNTIPIVMMVGDDPVRAGFVSTLSRPSGNVTGVALMLDDLSVKRLELLKAAVPKARRVVLLLNPSNTSSRSRLPELTAAAKSLGLHVTVVEVQAPDQLDNAFAAIAKARPQAILTVSDPLFFRERLRIGEFALEARIPLISDWRQMAEAGAVIAYGPSFSIIALRGARYIDRIMNGVSPDLLPIEQPREVDLVINRKAARTLSLTLPQSLLILANDVIE